MANATNKVVFITGSSGRIGAAIARKLHADGMNVILHCRKHNDDIIKLWDELNSCRENSAEILEAELTKTAELGSVIEYVVAVWGRLDCLINNASIFQPTPIAELKLSSWENIVESNLTAPLFLSQAAAPYLAAQKGIIINMADIHAKRPLSEYSAYCISKAGVVMLTKSLALELGQYEVRVNAIAPGAILWPEGNPQPEILEKVPLGRLGEIEDIANTASFLINDAPYITGQVLAVDGGRTVSQ